jgi:hypothetical protein
MSCVPWQSEQHEAAADAPRALLMPWMLPVYWVHFLGAVARGALCAGGSPLGCTRSFTVVWQSVQFSFAE